MPLAVVKHNDESAYSLEKFSLNKGRIYCFTDGFSECLDENKNEIGIDGVKKLILKHQNSSLQKELENATEDIRLKSLKMNSNESGIKEDNEILDDDLTIIGIGK
jgi:Amt family ammonium transporter